MVVTPYSVRATSAATTRVAPEATTQVATGVLETIVTPPVEVARMTTAVPETTQAVPVVAVETPSDSTAGQTSSRCGRRFWFAQRESQL